MCLIKVTWKTCSVGGPPGTWLGTTVLWDDTDAATLSFPTLLFSTYSMWYLSTSFKFCFVPPYFCSSQQAEGDSRSFHQLEVCYCIYICYSFCRMIVLMSLLCIKCCIFSILLYRDHQQALAERASLSQYLAQSQDELPAKTMKDSAIEAHLPLGTQPALREKYLNYHNSVRC